jgi:hypothetical protein
MSVQDPGDTSCGAALLKMPCIATVPLLQVSKDITAEDFGSQLLNLAVTATAVPLGSTETLQQTETLTLALAQDPQVSVELTLTNTSTIMAAGMYTVSTAIRR